jgi:hypothetical protein
MVYGVTGRFGEDEPQYTRELFAAPSLTDNSPVHPLPNWFVMYLHGRSGEYTTLFEAARSLHPWGIAAEIARYRDHYEHSRAIRHQLECLELEHAGITDELGACRRRLEQARAPHLLERLQRANARERPIDVTRHLAILPGPNRRTRGRGRPL